MTDQHTPGPWRFEESTKTDALRDWRCEIRCEERSALLPSRMEWNGLAISANEAKTQAFAYFLTLSEGRAENVTIYAKEIRS